MFSTRAAFSSTKNPPNASIADGSAAFRKLPDLDWDFRSGDWLSRLGVWARW